MSPFVWILFYVILAYGSYFDFDFLLVICNWALYHIRLNLSDCSDSEFFQSEFKKASCAVRPWLVRSELRQMLRVWMISGSSLDTINCELKVWYWCFHPPQIRISSFIFWVAAWKSRKTTACERCRGESGLAVAEGGQLSLLRTPSPLFSTWAARWLARSTNFHA